MADPLSTAASIVALLQLSATVVRYLSDVKDAPEDRQRLLLEISNLKGLLLTLQELVQPGGETWLATVRSLNESNGPVEQCGSLLKRLDEKLAPVVGLKKIKKAISWPFEKSDVYNILHMIERLKTLFSLALENDHFKLSCAIEKDITEMRDNVRELRKSRKDRDNRDIVTWLCSLNFHTKQNDFFERRQDGAGRWLLEDETFKRWLSGAERTLWCPGLPGAGKTVLASIIVDHLERSFARENVAIAYIYCSYKEQEGQTAVNLIASLLQQLVQNNPTISENITSLYQRHISKQTRPSLSECSNLLQSEARRFSDVFIIVDALDECNENNCTRRNFLAEIQKLRPHIHLLVTSRHILTTDSDLETAARVDIRASDEDVRRYLEGRIKTEPRLARHIQNDPALREDIIGTIVENAAGMFLLAQLHTDSLGTKATRKEVRKALETLPRALDDIYDEAMRRIERQNDDDKQLAERVLSWISYALRPLTLKELQHALAVEPGTSELDEDNLPDEELLTSVCAGLVTVDRESNIIRLVHYTTQDYFERTRAKKFRNAQVNIATTCLTYLSFDIFGAGPCPNRRILETRLQENALLNYAAKHWGHHARGDPEHEIKEMIVEFLSTGSKLLSSIQVDLASQYQYWPFYRVPKNVTGLQVAASLGLKEIAGTLLAMKADINAADSQGRTALCRGAEGGYLEVVETLLAAGANINATGCAGWTALQVAAERGHIKIVERLLAMGADVDAAAATGHGGRTALQAAVEGGHVGVVDKLLAAGADVNATGGVSWTALQAAAERGHSEVVERLLAAGADVNAAAGYYGLTALQAAAGRGHIKVAGRLLAAGANANAAASDHYGRTALQAAAGGGYVEVVDRLLAGGADVNAAAARDGGRTALQAAAERGDVEVVDKLLAAGADVNATGSVSWTALQTAAERGNSEVVERLLAAGADVNAAAARNGGRTALQAAAGGGYVEVVDRLLAGGADVNAAAARNDGRTALQAAAERGYVEVVDRLLAAGADVNDADFAGKTALQAAAERGYVHVVEKLQLALQSQ